MFDADDFLTHKRLDDHLLTFVPDNQLMLDAARLSAYVLGAAATLSPLVQSFLNAIHQMGIAAEEAASAMYASLAPTIDDINEFMEQWLPKERIEYDRPKPPQSLYAPRHIPPKGVDRVYFTGRHPEKISRATHARKGHRHG